MHLLISKAKQISQYLTFLITFPASNKRWKYLAIESSWTTLNDKCSEKMRPFFRINTYVQLVFCTKVKYYRILWIQSVPLIDRYTSTTSSPSLPKTKGILAIRINPNRSFRWKWLAYFTTTKTIPMQNTDFQLVQLFCAKISYSSFYNEFIQPECRLDFCIKWKIKVSLNKRKHSTHHSSYAL